MKNREILALFNELAGVRGWENLHPAKNLTMAFSGEVAELGRHFLWRNQWYDNREFAPLVDGEGRAPVMDRPLALRETIEENWCRCDEVAVGRSAHE
ncbi:hypothetical protein ACCI51_15920 [Microbulbifer echini]|uniref:Uncharacterized protein n=1 Tax=Microbulbifer echini TaxID=1529067 RepID=A0ABV4NRJ6_9GAMM|nr:hypothetical protein [uncultured Microbulbifer sp.]